MGSVAVACERRRLSVVWHDYGSSGEIYVARSTEGEVLSPGRITQLG